MPTMPVLEQEEIHNTQIAMQDYHQPQMTPILNAKDEKRIQNELCKAVKDFGTLPYEEAVWILIPMNEAEIPYWIQGRLNKYKIVSSYAFSNFVQFQPNEEERVNDISQLVCLSNLENLNALFISENIQQEERLLKLNRIAIQQMKLLTDDRRVKKLGIKK